MSELRTSEGVSRSIDSGVLWIHFRISEVIFLDPVRSESQSKGESDPESSAVKEEPEDHMTQQSHSWAYIRRKP